MPARVLQDQAEVLAAVGSVARAVRRSAEELDRATGFDIGLLARRLGEVTRWLRSQPAAVRARFGYISASTGAATALWAAFDPDAAGAAMVRLDLAARRLRAVRHRLCSSSAAAMSHAEAHLPHTGTATVQGTACGRCRGHPPVRGRAVGRWPLSWRATGSSVT